MSQADAVIINYVGSIGRTVYPLTLVVPPLAKVCLEVWPSLVDGIKLISFEDDQLIEASSLDGDEGLVNHLIHRVWWQGNDGDDSAFLGVVVEFFNRVDRVPSSTPAALVFLLLGRVGGGALVGAQVIKNVTRADSGPVGSQS